MRIIGILLHDPLFNRRLLSRPRYAELFREVIEDHLYDDVVAQ